MLVGGSASAVISQGALVLHDPLIARSFAMGETGVADNSDPANIYFNPANVVGPRSVYANGSRWGLVPDIADDVWIGRGSGGVRLRSSDGLALGADVTYGRLDFGESIATDPSGNPLGVFHSFEEYIALTFGAGLNFGDDWELRLGGSAKRYHADLAPPDVSNQLQGIELDAWAFDLGSTLARRYDVGEWDIVPAIAVACVNLGADIDTDSGDDPLPTRLHFGTSMRGESPTVQIFGADVPMLALVYNLEATERMHDGYFSWGLGGELAIAQVLFVRAGTLDIEDELEYQQISRSGWGVGVGVPVASLRTRVDYSKSSVSFTEDKFGLSIEWIF